MSNRTDRPPVLVQARRPDDLLDVPPIIRELMADEPTLVTHLHVADRYRKLVAETVELARELEAARREDDDARRQSLAAGKKPAQPRAPQVEDELRQARHDVELLAGAVRDSMAALATAAVPFLDAANAELGRRSEAALDRLRDLFMAAESAIAEHGALGAELVWVGGLRLSGRLVGYRPGTQVKAFPRTAEAVRRLSLDLNEDLRRAGEIAQAREREEAAELPLPPGARVWAPGERDKVVDESGEVVEAGVVKP
jgi:hypothetical protein